MSLKKLFNIKNGRVTLLKSIISLLVLNLLYVSFFFIRSYHDLNVQTSLKTSTNAKVWYVYKEKFSEKRYFSQKQEVQANTSAEVDFDIKTDKQIDYIGLYWAAEKESSIKLTSLEFTINGKLYQQTNPRRLVNYTSVGSLMNPENDGILIRSTSNTTNWIMLDGTGGINDKRDFKIHKPIPFIYNLILFLAILLALILSKDKSDIVPLKKPRTLHDLKVALFCLWVFILPYWIIISHSLMAVIVLITLVDLFKTKDYKRFFKSIRACSMILLLYMVIVLSSLFVATTDQVIEAIVDYSYLLLMPVAFMLIGEKERSTIFTFFKIGVLTYFLLLLVFIVQRHFIVHTDYSISRFLTINVEQFWHTSYLSLILLIIFIERVNKPLLQNKVWLLFYAVALLFMYLVGARLPFIVGGLIVTYMIFALFLDNYLKMVFLVFSAIAATLFIMFFLVKDLDSKVLEKVDSGSINTLDARLSIWEASFDQIKENLFFGVGKNNVKESIFQAIDGNNAVRFRNYNVHNQFLETFLAHGLMAFLLLSLVFVQLVKSKDLRSQAFAASIMLLFMVESYLQVQAGIILFTFFWSFFLRDVSNKKTVVHEK